MRNITEPFTEDHLNYTMEELGKIWDISEHQEYIWGVMVPEVFVKFYSDFFNISKVEAEKRISETPDKDDDLGDGSEML